MRRNGYPLYGARFCGDSIAMQVHDLDNEEEHCNIDEIIDNEMVVAFRALEEACSSGYENCPHCVNQPAAW